jgi:uncharacterized protein YdhG (YjbR/CyaY superfamily)
MQSKAEDVNSYLEEVPEERREAIKKLRDLCLGVLDGYEESMVHGMPSYRVPGEEVEVAFASQKNYISFYILKEEVINKFHPQLEGLNLGKGCIRYSRPEKIDFEVVKQLLLESFKSNSAIC